MKITHFILITSILTSIVNAEDFENPENNLTLPNNSHVKFIANNGKLIAVCVKQKEKDIIYINGVIIAEHNNIVSMVLSSNCDIVAYVAMEGSNAYIHHNKSVYGPFDNMDFSSLKITRLGNRIAYILKGNQDSIYIDNYNVMKTKSCYSEICFISDNKLKLAFFENGNLKTVYAFIPHTYEMETKYRLVLISYYNSRYKSLIENNSFDSSKEWDNAALKYGFASKKDFDMACEKWNDYSAAEQITKEISIEYLRKTERYYYNLLNK